MPSVQAEGSPAYLALYAMQSPRQANFLRLRRCSQALPALRALSSTEVESKWQRWYDHRFEYTPGDTITEAEVALRSMDEVAVVHFASFLELGVVGADGEPEAFSAFLGDHQLKAPKAEAKRVPAPPNVGEVEDLLVKFPWAGEYTRQAGAGDESASGGGRASSATSSRGGGDDATALTEQQIKEAWEALANKRSAFTNPAPLNDLCCIVRGGGWTAANKGVAADCMMAQASRSARPWCKRFKMNLETSYAFSLHGDQGATMLATEWASRMQHFYSLWVGRGGGPKIKYSEGGLASYLESPAWVKFVSDLPPGPTRMRAEAISALVPQNLS